MEGYKEKAALGGTKERWRCYEWVMWRRLKHGSKGRMRWRDGGSKDGRVGSRKKRQDEKTLGEINGRWEMKKGRMDINWEKEREETWLWDGRGDRRVHQGKEKRKRGESGRGGRRECAEANHNWPDSGRWYGAVAGWNVCLGVGEDYGVNVEVTEEMECIK